MTLKVRVYSVLRTFRINQYKYVCRDNLLMARYTIYPRSSVVHLTVLLMAYHNQRTLTGLPM